ncbi:hypothetical protein KUTeg_021309 [Tegillarca granosa]|uniref:Ig-like domain-containing protein n=1 Tax=Tegillarca granosa TaxID=220873 RepID=A0ABQ9EFI3_TEGGR|nr:hypothetical protein KUTeg_021309 [Tegillarca granosa]
MVVKLLLVGMVMVRLVNLGLCFNNRDNDLIVYTPKPAVLNEDFLMICETTKDINGIRWRKNGKNIAFVYSDTCFVADDSKNYSYSCKEGQFNLTIPKTKLTDELHGSVWSCVNPYGGVSNKLNLYVNNPPKITDLEAKTNPVMENDTLDLLCKADSFPTSNVSWMKSNTTLSYAAMADYHHIKYAKCLDTGTYICKASNGHGEPVSKAIDIFVNYVSEQNNLFMHTYRLIILSIKDEDFGYYTIDVENQYGQSTAQVHVVKKTKRKEDIFVQ